MCDNSGGKLTLQCTKCKAGYRGCSYTTGAYGVCLTGQNPTKCVLSEDRSNQNWKICPNPSTASCPSQIKCDYLSEYGGFRTLVTSPYVNLRNVDSCGKYKICSREVTDDTTDTYKLMCEQCAGGFVPDPTKMNSEVWGDCNEAGKYVTKCVEQTLAPVTAPTIAPSRSWDPPTKSPTRTPTNKEPPNALKDNMSAIVGGGVAGFFLLCFLATRMMNCTHKDDYDDDDDDDDDVSRFSSAENIEMGNFDGMKDRAKSEFEVTNNPMGVSKKKKKKEKEGREEYRAEEVTNHGDDEKKKKKKKNKRVSVGADGLLTVAPPPRPPPPKPKWEKYTDPSSGNPYWANVDTGETTWNDPRA